MITEDTVQKVALPIAHNVNMENGHPVQIQHHCVLTVQVGRDKNFAWTLILLNAMFFKG